MSMVRVTCGRHDKYERLWKSILDVTIDNEERHSAPTYGFSSAFEIEKTLNKSESKLNAVLSDRDIDIVFM